MSRSYLNLAVIFPKMKTIPDWMKVAHIRMVDLGMTTVQIYECLIAMRRQRLKEDLRRHVRKTIG